MQQFVPLTLDVSFGWLLVSTQARLPGHSKTFLRLGNAEAWRRGSGDKGTRNMERGTRGGSADGGLTRLSRTDRVRWSRTVRCTPSTFASPLSGLRSGGSPSKRGHRLWRRVEARKRGSGEKER